MVIMIIRSNSGDGIDSRRVRTLSETPASSHRAIRCLDSLVKVSVTQDKICGRNYEFPAMSTAKKEKGDTNTNSNVPSSNSSNSSSSSNSFIKTRAGPMAILQSIRKQQKQRRKRKDGKESAALVAATVTAATMGIRAGGGGASDQESSSICSKGWAQHKGELLAKQEALRQEKELQSAS